MSGRRHTPEQIINKLRQAEVEIAKGGTISKAAKKIGVTGHLWQANSRAGVSYCALAVGFVGARVAAGHLGCS